MLDANYCCLFLVSDTVPADFATHRKQILMHIQV